MKSLIITICMMIFSLQLMSQNIQITENEAVQAAITWVQGRYKTSGISVIRVNRNNGRNGIVLYEVETSSGQSVLLSGSRACLPILGTYKGSVLTDDSIPCGLDFMLNYYMERIDSSFTHYDYPLYYEDEWQKLINGKAPLAPKDSPVAPLLKSSWKQKYPNNEVYADAYNVEIVPGSGCSHCRAGCVAVAMGQVLYYWQHPILSFELTEQFDWCSMADSLVTTEPGYENKRDAIAYLLKECGESVDMDYGCESSSANLGDASDALRNNYGFHEHTVWRQKWAWWDGWEDNVIDDLSRGWPVIYGGQRKFFGGGHAFVCDGYDGGHLFHFNWGWGGKYNAPDFYYTLRDPNPKGDTNYHYWQEAIFNARPANDQELCNAHLNLSDFYYWNEFMMGNRFFGNPLPCPIYELVPKTMTTLTSASASSPESWRTIPAGATAVYQAHEEVILQDGFEAEAGCEFEARIEPCALCDEAGNNMQGANLPEGMASVGDQPDTTGGTVAYAVGQPQELPSDALYPNPTDGPLTMSTDGMAQAVLVYTLGGNPVGGWRMSALTETSLSIDVSALAPGTYLLSVATPTGTRTAKFIRR